MGLIKAGIGALGGIIKEWYFPQKIEKFQSFFEKIVLKYIVRRFLKRYNVIELCWVFVRVLIRRNYY